MIWENGIETCIISYMKRVACPAFDARYSKLGAGALGRPRRMVRGGRREERSGWGTHVYLWQIHFDIWQNQYNIVKFKKKQTQHSKKKNIHLALEQWPEVMRKGQEIENQSFRKIQGLGNQRKS